MSVWKIDLICRCLTRVSQTFYWQPLVTKFNFYSFPDDLIEY